jgi:predicted XRE-type DNA-binding protein
MKYNTPIHPGSGNVFADLRLPDADDLSIQAELTRLLYLRIKELGLTQVQAANRLSLKQPDVSRLMNGRHTGFSAERLFRFLNALDQDIQIIIRLKPPRARRSATVSVIAA